MEFSGSYFSIAFWIIGMDTSIQYSIQQVSRGMVIE